MKLFANFLLLTGCLFTTGIFAKLQPITLKQTVETAHVDSTKISPNGKHIAYTKVVPRETYKDDDGKPYAELHISDIQGHSRRFITGKQNVNKIAWGAGSRFIYFITKRNKDTHAGIYRIAVDGGEAEKVVTAGADIAEFTVNADESKLVYLAQPKTDKSEEKVKVKGFKAKVYEESKKITNAYLVDLNNKKLPHSKLEIDDHILSALYHPKNDQILFRVAPSALVDDKYVASQYRIYNQSGKLLNSIKTEGKLGNASWSNDGQYIALIGAENINDPSAGRLIIAKSSNGKIINSMEDYPGHVKALQWLSDYQLAYLGHVGTQSEVAVLNLDSGSVTPMLQNTNEVISDINADSSGKILLGIGSSDSHPKEVVHLTNNKVKRLTNVNPWLKSIEMPKQETVNYKARDGIDLQGVLIYPGNYKKRKRYPLIMMVHGGPESHVSDGWLDKYSYPIKYAAANGFAVFLPNYRGSTGRGVAFSKLGQADYAGGEFNDLVDAITHLSNMGVVDKKRVGITGGSYGGYASAWAATALSEHFAASVMFVGISNQLSKFGTTDIPKEMHNVHARNYPWEKWQWMLERSPIYHTDKAKTPILIMHGDSDTRVHPSQSMELYRYIKTRTDTPVRLVFYPDEGHGNKKTAAQLDYSMRLMRWMEFYLKGNKKKGEKPEYKIDHSKFIIVD